MTRRFGWRVKALAGTLAMLVLVVLAANVGYVGGSTVSGNYCTTCHQIQTSYDSWASSAHRGMDCKECHGSAFSLDMAMHANNFRHVFFQVSGRIPERVRLKDGQVDRIMANCTRCHMGKEAAWRAGGHSIGYAHVFLSEKVNAVMAPMDDCLRCHGMFAEGSIADIVTPVATQGPWRLVQGSFAQRAAIPCIACHQMHRPGTPSTPPDYANPKAIAGQRKVAPASLGFYDRRERRFFHVDELPLPAMAHEGRTVTMSPDRRQANCYMCHTPNAVHAVGSSDDRTAIGVHEGIGCLGCHDAHTLDARASCANCHPAQSNCGLDVATMDTTFKSAASRHNVHFVACVDCHVDGVPASARQRARDARVGQRLVRRRLGPASVTHQTAPR